LLAGVITPGAGAAAVAGVLGVLCTFLVADHGSAIVSNWAASKLANDS